MLPNFQLLDKTLAHIKTLPALATIQDAISLRKGETIEGHEDGTMYWYQGDWIAEGACGTACCFIGHAYLLEGLDPKLVNEQEYPEDIIVNIMKDILYIDEEEMEQISNPDNTLEDIEEIISEWKEQYNAA